MSLNVASKWDFKDDSYLRMDNLQYRFIAILHSYNVLNVGRIGTFLDKNNHLKAPQCSKH